MSSPQSSDFLQAFSSDKKFCLSLPFLWTVTIDGVTESTINFALTKAGENWKAKINPNSMTKNGNILAAREVSIPNEASSFNAMSIGGSSGGYLPGYVMNNRNDFLSRAFAIHFIETKEDLEHGFFRPWMIALGIQGLIANGPPLKSTIEVKQYSNDGTFRKGFRFEKAWPTSVDGFKLSHEGSEYIIKSVSFACHNYEQL